MNASWSNTAKQFPSAKTRYALSTVSGKINEKVHFNNTTYPTKSSSSFLLLFLHYELSFLQWPFFVSQPYLVLWNLHLYV
jgi:hypothetical protein